MKRPLRTAPAIALGVALAQFVAGGQPLRATPMLELTVEPKTATVGDRITAQLTVRLDPGDRRTPSLPESAATWGDLELLQATPAVRAETAPGNVWSQTVVLAAFRTGPIKLPPFELTLSGAGEPPVQLLSSGGIELEIRTVLPTEGEAEPMGAEPPRALPLTPAFAWSAGALAALAMITAVAAARRRRAGLTTTAARLAPWPELENALESLAAVEPAAAHALLSVALRRYLGRTLDLRALEATTTEIAQRLSGSTLEGDQIRATTRLLRELDQVKFARRPTATDELARRISESRELAENVERALHPEPPAA